MADSFFSPPQCLYNFWLIFSPLIPDRVLPPQNPESLFFSPLSRGSSFPHPSSFSPPYSSVLFFSKIPLDVVFFSLFTFPSIFENHFRVGAPFFFFETFFPLPSVPLETKTFFPPPPPTSTEFFSVSVASFFQVPVLFHSPWLQFFFPFFLSPSDDAPLFLFAPCPVSFSGHFALISCPTTLFSHFFFPIPKKPFTGVFLYLHSFPSKS